MTTVASDATGTPAPDVLIRGPRKPGYDDVLTRDAIVFLAGLARRFGPRIRSLLARRAEEQARYDAGALPGFGDDTREIRESDWTVAPLPADLQDRRVEITGPVDRKMVINALNSGATHFMADFEDATAPTWDNLLEGQINLRDAVSGTITYVHPQTGKVYELAERTAVLLVRPRGLHLPEAHFVVDGDPIPGALFDFGLFFFHNAAELVDRGTGPYFYLPKLEHHLEARLWNDVFVHAQAALGLPRGTVKATVLVETLPAAFRMHEILWELRDHAAGLNCGRWDYIFSVIKTLSAHRDRILPDRSQVGMTQPFMRAYTQLVVQTCHRRGAHAMGGMAAQIPIKRDPDANEAALARVREDKLREVTDGHDGTWVAHPALVPLAREVFDAHMKGPNQLGVLRDDVVVTARDLLAPPEGDRTMEGLRTNVRVGVQYLASWLRGQGCVPLYDLMEDAATAEISRAQVWQWIRHGATLASGETVTAELLGQVLDDELAAIRARLGPDRYRSSAFDAARRLFEDLSTSEALVSFLTLPAYDQLTSFED